MKEVVSDNDKNNVQIESKDATSNGRYWFMKESDLQSANAPGSLTLFSVTYSVCINSKRAVQGWYKTFKKLLDLSPQDFDRVSGNPFNRFDNSTTAPKRVLVVRRPSKLKDFIYFLDTPENKKRVHHDVEVSSAIPTGMQEVGVCSLFTTYSALNAFVQPKRPEQKTVLEVHGKLFNATFTQSAETRTLSAMATQTQVQAWFKTERRPEQATVMNGKSANEVAKSLGLPEIGYEWLHLVAHSLGPAQNYGTPQHIDNLVLGTSAANSQMLEYEGKLQQWALIGGHTIDLKVTVKCFNLKPNEYACWLATEIKYCYQILNTAIPAKIINSENVTFNPFDGVTPSLAEYLIVQKFLGPPVTNKAKKLSFAAVNAPKKPGLDQLASGEIQMHGLDFYQITPRSVSSSGFGAGKRGRLLLAADLDRADTSTPPDGCPFAAMTNALGKTEVPVKGALLNDGRRFATIELESKGFSFSQLFKEFECEDVNFFIFDDVNIHLEQQPAAAATENVVIFSGILRMDRGPLASLRDLLKLEKGLYLSGEIGIGEQSLTGKIEPDYFTLCSAASFHVPLFDGLTLTAAALQITIGRRIDYQTMSLGWFCRATLTGSLEISGLGSQKPAVLNCLLAYNNGILHASAVSEGVDGLFGLENLTLDYLEAQFDVGAQNDVELSAILSTGFRSFGFGGKLAPQFAGLFARAENFTLTDLNDIFVNITGEDLSLPEFGVDFEKVFIGLATADGSVDNVGLTKGLTLAASVSVHGHNCDVVALISPDGVSFTGSLSNLEIGPVQIETAKLHLQIYKASSGKPVEFAISGAAVIESIRVECKVRYEKQDGSWTCVLYAGLQAASFGLSTVFPPASGTFVDSLRFRKIAFVYASADCTTQDADYAFPVRQGLQLMGVLEEISALSTLTHTNQSGLVLSAHFGRTTTDIAITLEGTKLQLGKSVSCDPFRIMIVMSPQPALDLVFGLNVSLPKQITPLHFDLMLEVGAIGARGSATMKNWWVEPFGVEGLKIGPALALQLGINYAQFASTGLPDEFGFAGGLALGEVEAQMALSISEDPSHEILLGSLSQLTPQDLVKFAGTITGLRLTPEDVPNFFEIHDLQLYCAPTGGSIGTITFEPGFSFNGKLVLFGKTASVYTRFGSQGVVAKGHLDNLELGPLKIRGEQGKDAGLDLELTADKQAVFIDGAFDFLDSEMGLFVDISNRGVKFHFEETFLGLLKYVIHGESQGALTQLSSLDFLLSAQFDNDLTAYLKNTVADKIHAAINVVEVGIEEAQRKADEAEKVYKNQFDAAKQTLDTAQAAAYEYLRQCRQCVDAEKQKYTAALEAAKQNVAQAKAVYDNALQAAQNAVGKAQGDYEAVMRSAEAALTQAQADYDGAMRSAQQAVDDAQRTYDNAMGSAVAAVQNARKSLSSLQNEINSAVDDLNHLKWYKAAYKGPYLSAKIAGLEIAMRTAQGTLYAVEGILQGVRYGAQYTALEGAKQTLKAVRYGGKYAALEGAKKTVEATRYVVQYGALEAAKQTLAAVQHGTEYTLWQGALQTLQAVETTGRAALTAAEATLANIGQSAVYVALEAAKQGLEAVKQGTAAAAFESAKVALEAARQGTKAMLKLWEFIARHAGDVIDVKKVGLSSRLKAIKGGELFNAQLAIALLGHDYDWALDFNVRDAAGFVESLFKKALDEAKTLAEAAV